MNGEQPVTTPLREVGIDLDPPFAKRLTVGHKIQRVWALLFGKHNDELRPVWVSRGGILGTAPMPLTDMIYVTGGVAAKDTPIDLGEYADVVWCSGWGEMANTPQLMGRIGTGAWQYVGFMSGIGGPYLDSENIVFPYTSVLYAHVNSIMISGVMVAYEQRYHAYRYPER